MCTGQTGFRGTLAGSSGICVLSVLTGTHGTAADRSGYDDAPCLSKEGQSVDEGNVHRALAASPGVCRSRDVLRFLRGLHSVSTRACLWV